MIRRMYMQQCHLVDLSEEVQDLHEILPAVMAGYVAKVGGMLAKGGAMASKTG